MSKPVIILIMSGGAPVHARGRTWGQLILQDVFQKER